MGTVVLISAGSVVGVDRSCGPGWVRIVGERIVAVGAGDPPGPPDHDFPDHTLVPGLVDVHVHGGGGSTFTTGDADDAWAVVQTHLRHGTTTMLASLVTAAVDDLERQVSALAPLVHQRVLGGIHLEGPWLSTEHRGAHDRALLCPPTPEAVRRILQTGGGAVRMVTLAPELQGGLDAVRQLVDQGVVVALGHTDATYDQARAAIEEGATVGTHLFNGMRAFHHREPGPALALLEEPRAYVEAVADGVHLHPGVLAYVAATARERWLLVTDAMAAAGAPDGQYLLGGLEVDVRNREARLRDGGALAGSTLTLHDAVRYAVREAGIPLADAVCAAATTPARALGLQGVGAIAEGHLADLLLLDDALDIARIWKSGVPVAR